MIADTLRAAEEAVIRNLGRPVTVGGTETRAILSRSDESGRISRTGSSATDHGIAGGPRSVRIVMPAAEANAVAVGTAVHADGTDYLTARPATPTGQGLAAIVLEPAADTDDPDGTVWR